MEFIILLVFAIMCSGLLMVMYQKHSELTDLISNNQDKIKFLETAINPGENDSVLRGRVSNTESRVSNVERMLKSITDQINQLATANAAVTGNAVATAAAGGASEEQMHLINHQINFVNDRVTKLIESINKVDNAVTLLSQTTLAINKGNLCIFSSNQECPPGLTMAMTFGFITHNPQGNLPVGYFTGGNHAPGWDWMHGGLCCASVGKIPPPRQ